MDRLCSKCGTSERYKNGRCKECKRIWGKIWRESNKGVDRICPKCGAQTEGVGKCKDCQREFNRRNSKLHGKQKRERNKEKISEYHKRYYQEHKEYYKIKAAMRERELKADAETTAHIAWCKTQLCTYCNGTGGTHDHVIPISKGGTNTIKNIVPACSKCNDSKGVKTLDEWLGKSSSGHGGY